MGPCPQPGGGRLTLAILFVLSFPPLFGQEVSYTPPASGLADNKIVAILVGVVWGLWVGFGIVSTLRPLGY